MSINELFNANTNATSTNARSLPGTAELTILAGNIATHIVKTMEADIETYRPRIQKSATDSKELDAIIEELGEFEADQADFLSTLDDSTIDNILRSQQSKRSRAKGKAMTLDNYHSMLTAAVAENIIRTFTGKAKSYTGGNRGTGTVDYTGAQLEKFAADQDLLRKEIRNVQSKKSIMKSKEGFSETDERWLQLLKAEQQLKDLRVGGTVQYVEVEVEVDTTKWALADLLGGKDISKLKVAEAHELLEQIAELIASKPVIEIDE